MKNQSNEKTPTAEELHAARQAGFTNSINHLSPEKRERLLKSYVEQDARREANVRKFRDILKEGGFLD